MLADLFIAATQVEVTRAMPKRRKLLWLATAAVFGLAAAWLGSPSPKQPLWTADEPGAQHFIRFTSDGSAAVYFAVHFQVAEQTWGFRAVRRDARSGQVVGESFIRVDLSQLEGSSPNLLGDCLVRLMAHNWREKRVMIWLYDLESGRLAAGPITANGVSGVRTDLLNRLVASDIADGAMDPHGRWFAQTLPGQKRVRIVAFRDGTAMFEFDRPGSLAGEVLAIREGEQVLIRWVSTTDNSELIESRDIATGTRLAELILKSGSYAPRSTLISDRVYLFGTHTTSVGIEAGTFGAERDEDCWKRNPRIVAFSSPPDSIAVRRQRGELRSWQLTINGWCKSLGIREWFQTGKYEPFEAIVDTRSCETADEVPTNGTGCAMSPACDLMAQIEPGRRVLVWPVRRTPDRRAFFFGFMAAISVLSFAYWRNRR